MDNGKPLGGPELTRGMKNSPDGYSYRGKGGDGEAEGKTS
jgi:hypothetical protein